LSPEKNSTGDKAIAAGGVQADEPHHGVFFIMKTVQ
jgi:hypothetical protein